MTDTNQASDVYATMPEFYNCEVCGRELPTTAKCNPQAHIGLVTSTTNPTDTNQASELFDLCKKVYELTGWGDMQNRSHTWTKINEKNKPQSLCPLYTSDYLLEKLPRSIKRYGRFELVPTMRNAMWSAGYWTGDRLDTLSVVDYTPLKALLKLTIALSEAGELNDQSS